MEVQRIGVGMWKMRVEMWGKKRKLKLSENVNICFMKLEHKRFHYQGLIINDPNQRYYLNGMRMFGPSVLILFHDSIANFIR